MIINLIKSESAIKDNIEFFNYFTIINNKLISKTIKNINECNPKIKIYYCYNLLEIINSLCNNCITIDKNIYIFNYKDMYGYFADNSYCDESFISTDFDYLINKYQNLRAFQ